MQTMPTTSPAARPVPVARSLSAGQGMSFVTEAWRIFCAAPLIWIAIAVIYVGISIVLTIIPLVGSVAHSVLTPVFVGGMMLGCHALARGQPLEIAHLFAGFKDGKFGPLAVLGLVLLALAIVLGIVLIAAAAMTVGMSGLGALIDYGNPNAYATLAGAGAGILLVALLASLGGIIVWMALWFAPALVAIDGVEPVAAMKASFAACLSNIMPFVVFSLVYLGLSIVATIPFGLGWIVLAPMTAGMCYASYRQIFGQ